MSPARAKMNHATDAPLAMESQEETLHHAPQFKDAHQAHSIEREVYKALLATPGLKISALVIHRIPGGFCLEGTIEVDRLEDDPRQRITSSIEELEGVCRVVNRMVTRCTDSPSEVSAN